MKLWLVVEDAAGAHRDIAVDADETHTVQDLLGALSMKRAVLGRTGVPLDQAATLVEARLRNGDVLTARGSGVRGVAPSTSERFRLVVAGGPASGRVVGLPEGKAVVGRSKQADVPLEDPALSRLHVAFEVEGDALYVQDEASTHGTFVHGQPLTERQRLLPGTLVEAGDTVLRIEPATDDAPPAAVRDGRLQFSRPPRRRPTDLSAVHELRPPPDPLTKRRIPLSSSLLPLVAAPVMAAGGGRGYLAIAALSPVMAVASVLEERRAGGKDRQAKLEQFYDDLARTSEQMSRGLQEEEAARWAASPDPAEVLRRATRPSSRLWERRPGDPDFLALRVGWADQPSRATWAMRDGGDDAVRQEAKAELDQHSVARAVPVVLDLTTSPVVGLAGPPEAVEETTRWLVAQAAVLHSPRDLAVAAALTEPQAAAWEWLAWLPHARSDSTPFAAHPLAVGTDAARALVGSLNDLVAARREQSQGRLDTVAAALPAVLLVLDEDLQVPRSAVATLLEEGPAVGIRVLWVGDRVDGLPGETRTIVTRDGDKLVTADVSSGAETGPAQPDRFSREQATALARALAGVRDATARQRGGGEIPNFVALPDLLGGGEPTAEGVVASWERHSSGLAAPVGVSDEGPFVIDLRRDGPHALLGGTTGAGKSELLQTYVAALAFSIPPTRLTFLLVDYKGGAAFKDCIQLPHVVGFVTDLDGHLVHRALVSLNAELHRRERLLASVGAKDIIEMERKAPDQAPAALLLVVDEFATLAKELPEFVDGVVNVAQRGRSLGIHMLLATQRPAGAINDNIRANTNLRMALRMNDEADSEDVINSKLAAGLPRSLPGRAFARTGASELTEVQVGYAGGHTLSGGDVRPLLVHPLRRGQVERAKVKRTAEHDDRPTDLQKVVAVVREAQSQLDLPAQPAPWLPALPELLPLADLPASDDPTSAVVGLLDLPQHQAQAPFVMALSQGSVLVFGTSGSGKTTLLRTLAVALAEQLGPKHLHLYGLDFGARGLGALQSLPQCGTVVDGDDVERVQRLFALLRRSMADRRKLFGDVGCGDIREYDRLAGAERPLPRVLVLLDGYGGFTQVFEKVDFGSLIDELPQLISDGRALGISFVLTADRPGAVPMSLMSTIGTRITLRLADPDDYSSVGLDGRDAREAHLPPGRAFTGETVEVQTAVVGGGAEGNAQANAVETAGRRLRDRWGEGSASRIAPLPEQVDLAQLLPDVSPLRPVMGVGQSELAALPVDLVEHGNLLVAGPRRSGRSTALACLATGLRHADPGLELHLLAPRRTPLTSLPIWTSIAKGETAIEELTEALASQLELRDESSAPIVLVLDDGHELVDTTSDTTLEVLARRGRDSALWILGSAESGAAHRAYGGWITQVRKERHGLLLQPDPDLDGDLLGVRLPKARLGAPGRGLLVAGGGLEIVQVATAT